MRWRTGGRDRPRGSPQNFGSSSGGMRSRNAQRIDLGDQVSAHPVVADQQVDALLPPSGVPPALGFQSGRVQGRIEDARRRKRRTAGRNANLRAVGHLAKVVLPIGRKLRRIIQILGIEPLDMGKTQNTGLRFHGRPPESTAVLSFAIRHPAY